jgi:nicotine blue oxidoreductase
VIPAVVLAGGAARRFGEPKQRLLLPNVLDRLAQTSVEEVVVVSGAHELDSGSARLVECSDWERGPGATLRCGLAALADEAVAAVVCLADGPNLAPEAVERVLRAWREGAGEVVAAGYGGERGHPVVIGRTAWSAVPDEGMRSLAATLIPCDDLGSPGDIDLAEDLG